MPKALAALVDESKRPIADELWGNSQISTMRASAQRTDKHTASCGALKERYCGMAYLASQRLAMDMVRTVASRADAAGFAVQSFIECQRFDETPLWLRAGAIAEGDGAAEEGTIVPSG